MNRQNLLLWLGPLVGALGFVSYFVVFARFPALRDNSLLNLGLVTIGAGLSALGVLQVVGSNRPRAVRWVAWLGLSFAGGCAALLFFYVFAVSYWLPEPDPTTLALDAVPEITLVDQHGGEVALNERNGRRLVLSFYRGHW